ncbi:sulfatase [Psychromarinibacter halotolerans]|uniref:Sulfatase n=1 Tax=Psychromarinibacter halotolerans TaxID=1775175 RepID=A0ABV7GS22_9RHOB|nr:sulfatase-like hydrolase/transferase [Psychromarinibacter halotolerans]MDF0595260.1 sulfatase-like hydrolase/transferase [Psychromarinibacter halotolerans]
MTQRPDIVMIVTDQQRYDTIRALGASHMDTPNIDRLAETGVSFSECHVTAPSCVPCRASLFTGYYPHTNGVVANGQPWNRTWVSDLAAAGYHCVNIGKMHTIPYDAKAGFHERYVVENKDRFMEGRWFFDEWDKALAAHGLKKQQRVEYRKRDDYRDRLGAFTWDLPPQLQSDNFVGGMARWWLETKPVKEPLFMVIGFPGPHPPYDPTPEIAEKYMARDVPLPEVTEAEMQALHPVFKEKRRHDVEVDHDSVAWKLDPTREELHRMRAYYYANVEMIDREVGAIMDTLEARGNLDNTIVIFTSDHGDCLGDHGLIQKWAPYDEVTRVPLIVSAPGWFEGGRSVDALVQFFDLGPTILEWAGVTPDATFEAQSLNPALEGAPFEGRSHVFCEQGGDVNLTGAEYLTMVRSRTHKLVHFKGMEQGQLFDLQADPRETDDRWDDPACAGVRADLMGVLMNWHIDSAVHTKNARRRIVSHGGPDNIQDGG